MLGTVYTSLLKIQFKEVHGLSSRIRDWLSREKVKSSSHSQVPEPSMGTQTCLYFFSLVLKKLHVKNIKIHTQSFYRVRLEWSFRVIDSARIQSWGLTGCKCFQRIGSGPGVPRSLVVLVTFCYCDKAHSSDSPTPTESDLLILPKQFPELWTKYSNMWAHEHMGSILIQATTLASYEKIWARGFHYV
jgi:hypothetical protein